LDLSFHNQYHSIAASWLEKQENILNILAITESVAVNFRGS